MTEALLTRTIITRNLFKQADLAGFVIRWFEVVEHELGSTSSEFKTKLEIGGVVYVFVVHNTLSESDLKNTLYKMLKRMRENL